jgi:hypothetical protein
MESRVSQALRCDDCGDVIGVYEPMTIMDGGRARETSLAAEPRLAAHGQRSFHRACFDTGRPPAAGRNG